MSVDVWVSELRSASLRFAYEIYRGDELLADGTTRHAVVGNNGRPRVLPPQLRDAISTDHRTPVRPRLGETDIA